MQVKHLDHVNLSVANFDETVDWYRRVFGFELVEEDVRAEDGVRWGVIRSGEAMLCIYEQPELKLDHYLLAREAGIHSVAHFAFRITDRPAWEATVEREQLPLRFGGAVPYPHSTSWYVYDPTGYEIEVAAWDDDRVAFDGLKEPATKDTKGHEV